MNNIGRMLIYQLFSLPEDACSEFVLGMIEFQPNAELKKMLFNELSYILLSCIKKISVNKKYKFKVNIKGR